MYIYYIFFIFKYEKIFIEKTNFSDFKHESQLKSSDEEEKYFEYNESIISLKGQEFSEKNLNKKKKNSEISRNSSVSNNSTINNLVNNEIIQEKNDCLQEYLNKIESNTFITENILLKAENFISENKNEKKIEDLIHENKTSCKEDNKKVNVSVENSSQGISNLKNKLSLKVIIPTNQKKSNLVNIETLSIKEKDTFIKAPLSLKENVNNIFFNFF